MGTRRSDAERQRGAGNDVGKLGEDLRKRESEDGEEAFGRRVKPQRPCQARRQSPGEPGAERQARHESGKCRGARPGRGAQKVQKLPCPEDLIGKRDAARYEPEPQYGEYGPSRPRARKRIILWRDFVLVSGC